MKKTALFATFFAGASMLAMSAALAANLAIVSGATGGDLDFMRAELDKFEKANGDKVTITPMPSSTTDQFGQYRLWLAAGNSDIDVYQTDVIWAPQLAEQFVDLTAAAKDVAKTHFPSIIQSQTVNGKLVAMPFFTDAPALYYRKDLLDKYKQAVPKTWDEMASVAKVVMDGERAAGNKDMWGFVFQGIAGQAFVGVALEHEAPHVLGARGALAVHHRLGGGRHLIPGLGRAELVFVEQILAIEQSGGVGEVGNGDELAVHRLRLDDRGEVSLDDVLGRRRQINELIGELRRPDHVRHVHVDVRIAGGEPEPILAELVGGR